MNSGGHMWSFTSTPGSTAVVCRVCLLESDYTTRLLLAKCHGSALPAWARAAQQDGDGKNTVTPLLSRDGHIWIVGPGTEFVCSGCREYNCSSGAITPKCPNRHHRLVKQGAECSECFMVRAPGTPLSGCPGRALATGVTNAPIGIALNAPSSLTASLLNIGGTTYRLWSSAPAPVDPADALKLAQAAMDFVAPPTKPRCSKCKAELSTYLDAYHGHDTYAASCCANCRPRGSR